MKTTIYVMDYPTSFEFETSVPLPKFKYGCKTRSEIVQKELAATQYDAPHEPCDFIVERVEPGKHVNTEVWHLGS